MMQTVANGTAHKLPLDMKKALLSTSKALSAWQNSTPLARNEWICWTTSVKTDETRKEHVKRLIEDLSHGKKRPCCWMGCIHRKDKPLSATQKWLIDKKSKKRLS